MTLTNEEAMAELKTIVPQPSQDKMTYLYCYKCQAQKWYYLDMGSCGVHVDAVECDVCGEWLQ